MKVPTSGHGIRARPGAAALERRPAPLARLLPFLLLAGTILAVYSPLFGAGFIWDDDTNLTENRNLDEAAGLGRIWLVPSSSQQYYPLTYTTFWFERRLWGSWAGGYHLTNILLQILDATLLALLLRRLGVRWPLAGALLFAIHPLQVETVAWITERRNLLSAALALAACLAWCRSFGLGEAAPRRRTVWVAVATAAFTLALAAKSAVAPVPLVMLVLLWWKRRAVSLRDAMALLPALLIAAGMGTATLWLEIQRNQAGSEWQLSLPARFVLAGRAGWFYAAKTVLPVGLAFIYPRWEIEPIRPADWLWPVAAAAVVAGVWAARRRVGNGPLAGVLAYGLLLSPALGFFQVYFFVYSFVQDHFQYFAGMVLVPLLVAGAAKVACRAAAWIGTARAVAASRVAAVAAIGTLAAVSWTRCHPFRDEATLYEDTLARNPTAWMAHNNYGNWLVDQGRIEEGIPHLVEAVRLFPRSAEGAASLGAGLLKAGQSEAAVPHLRRALDLSPRLDSARQNLVTALRNTGRTEEAIHEGQTLVRLAPENPFARHKLAQVLLAAGRAPEARGQLAEAVRLLPDSPELRSDYARALALTGQREAARQELETAIRTQPGYALAHHRLGLVLLDLGDAAGAKSEFERALALAPDLAEAREGLARSMVAAEQRH